jgi:hypothetical protein
VCKFFLIEIQCVKGNLKVGLAESQSLYFVYYILSSSVAHPDPHRMVLGLLDPDPVVRSTDPDSLNPSKNSK